MLRSMLKDRSERLGYMAPFLCGAAYFVVLALFATLLGTWTDEEYTLATTAHGIAFAWRRAIDYELQAPLYFAVVALWREINPSVWFARLFSIASATGFFFALLPILRRVAPDRKPLWPALAIACNPFVVYMAFDIRLYSTALLISALSWLAFDAGFVSASSTRARVAFGILAVIALYTQYFLAFAFVGNAVVLLVRRRFRTLVPYALVLAASGIAAFPLLRIVRSQVGGSGETAASGLTLLPRALHPWLNFILPYRYAWDALHVRAAHIALVAVVVLLIVYARPRLGTAFRTALACAATIEALFIAVVLVLQLDLDTRHYVVIFVPAMVAGYALIDALRTSAHPRIGRVVTCIYGLLTLAVLYADHHQIAQSGDSKRVAAYLEAHAKPGAVVAVFPADAIPTYARQYHGDARLVPFPKPLSQTRYDLGAIDVDDEREALQALARLRGAPELWFVIMGSCDGERAEYGCKFVLDALHDGSRISSERRYFESRVFGLEVDPATAGKTTAPALTQALKR